MLSKRIVRLVTALALGTFTGMCGLAAAEDPVVATVTVSQDTVVIAAGGNVQLSAVVRSATGDTLDVKVAWASTDTTVAQVSDKGRVSGVTAGSAMVVASAGSVADTVTVTVRAEEEETPAGGSIATVAVFPETAEVAAGDSVQFTAEAKDTLGYRHDLRSLAPAELP